LRGVGQDDAKSISEVFSVLESSFHQAYPQLQNEKPINLQKLVRTSEKISSLRGNYLCSDRASKRSKAIDRKSLASSLFSLKLPKSSSRTSNLLRQFYDKGARKPSRVRNLKMRSV
jgi:hypothetical protein